MILRRSTPFFASLLLGAVVSFQPLPSHAQKAKTPAAKAPVSHKSLLPAQQASANTKLVGLWTDQYGIPDQTKAKAMTKQAVQQALTLGADVNAKDHDGTTALMQAAYADKLEIVQLLISSGADVKAKDHTGQTALVGPSVSSDPAIVKLLLAKGASINTRGAHSMTPLMWHAYSDHAAVVKLLLAKHALVNLKDDRGQTALTWANSFGHIDIVQLLRAAGAK